ncbi:MAG: hypothetical protein MZV70_49040 [Desulfobacterales bacterium]|nr:hypothetical protein [Desulfobacterales bacterium]
MKEALAQAEGRLRSRADRRRCAGKASGRRAARGLGRTRWRAYEEALATGAQPAVRAAGKGARIGARGAGAPHRRSSWGSRRLLDSDTQLEQRRAACSRTSRRRRRPVRAFAAEADKLKALVQTAKTPVRITIAVRPPDRMCPSIASASSAVSARAI